MASKPVHHEVLLTRGAEQDLEAIYDYIAEFDSVENATHLLDRLLELATALGHAPLRGSYPRELATLGIKEYRQVLFKPYRMVYRILGNKVVIYLVADGRRDMQSLLSRRLLTA